MKFRLNIASDNAAFEDGDAELARILRKFAERLEDGTTAGESEGSLRDYNGNRVGTWTRAYGEDEADEDAARRVPVVTVYSDFEWTVDPEGAATVVYAEADGDEICGCGYVIAPRSEGGWYHRDGRAADDHTPEP